MRKEMAVLANKCCFSNPLMLSDDLSLFEALGYFTKENASSLEVV